MTVAVHGWIYRRGTFARRRRGQRMRRQRGGCWRLRWLWKGRTARRRRGAAGWTRQTLRDWVYRYNAGGLAGLSNRTAPGRTPYLSAAQKAELSEIVRAGPDPGVDRVVRWRRIDLKHLIKERFGVVMHERTVGKQLAELGFRRLSVRPAHPQSDPAAQAAFKKNFAQLVAAAPPPEARGKPLEIWFQDEARIGQQGTLTRVWARRGTRPRAPRDTRYKWAYIFGAVCPQRAAAAALVMPFADTQAMNEHLAEIAKTVVPGAHAVIVLDGAGWHGSKALCTPDKHHTSPPAAIRAGTQPDRKRLGLPARQQTRHLHLRQLRPHRREVLRRVELLRRRRRDRSKHNLTRIRKKRHSIRPLV